MKLVIVLDFKNYRKLQGLEHDHGQTNSRARAQRLSAAHHKVTWSILIGSNIQTQEESNACLSVKGRVTVIVTCQCSENSYFCVL